MSPEIEVAPGSTLPRETSRRERVLSALYSLPFFLVQLSGCCLIVLPKPDIKLFEEKMCCSAFSSPESSRRNTPTAAAFVICGAGARGGAFSGQTEMSSGAVS